MVTRCHSLRERRANTDKPKRNTVTSRSTRPQIATSPTRNRMSNKPSTTAVPTPYRPKSDVPFFVGLGVLAGFYIALIAAMLLADVNYAHLRDFSRILGDADIRYAIRLSLISCTITTILALWVAV